VGVSRNGSSCLIWQWVAGPDMCWRRVFYIHHIAGKPVVEKYRRLARHGGAVISQHLGHNRIVYPIVKPDFLRTQDVWKTDGLVFPASV
jgi:hypothetical protein